MTTIYYLTVFWTPVHSFEKLSKYIIAYYIQGVPGGSEGKASVCNAGDRGLIPGSGRSPGEGKWPHTPVLLPGESVQSGNS